jgi:hypothetical protein
MMDCDELEKTLAGLHCGCKASQRSGEGDLFFTI